eukprot:gene12301-16497_t
MPHQLQNTWVIYEFKQSDEGSYGVNFKSICEFNSVEEFWKFWLFIPKPSEVFNEINGKRAEPFKNIKSFGLFKKGISPAWEDPANAQGSELVAVSKCLPEQTDGFWENLVLGLIGETIDEGEEICGCRIVDQKGKNKGFKKIELWLRTRDDAVCQKIKTKMCDVLTDGEASNPNSTIKAPEFELNKRLH